jgi:hypothetical protein
VDANSSLSSALPPQALRAAAAVAGVAFVIYRTTMLPGLELGDSASFQVMIGSPIITPRDAYPLYFALADVLYWIVGGDPARALNLASVLEAAIACGILTIVAADLSRSAAAGAAAALMFAGSYTFWSQSVIAEVYALHVLLIALSLLLLLRWARTPSTARLAAFFVVYAVSFGNHLMMILFAPAYALFIAASAPWRQLVNWRVASLALLAIAAGASLYLWNFAALWVAPSPPDPADAVQRFWADVTKSDWRESMILRVPLAMASERLRMYAFDVRQQFGWLIPVLAPAGFAALLLDAPRRAVMIAVAYAANVLFALAYNVGDSHVFFLPSHVMLAVLAAPGLVRLGELAAAPQAIAAIAVLLTGAQIYRDYPALDRSHDTRPVDAVGRIASGLDGRRAVLLTDLNWQLENGLNYFAKRQRGDLAVAWLPDVIDHAPALVRDNAAIGREIVATGRARAALDASHGAALLSTPDERGRSARVREAAMALGLGTPYVICILRPTREQAIEDAPLREVISRLTGGHLMSAGTDAFAAIVGAVGSPPVLTKYSKRPFREIAYVHGRRIEVRMDAWLEFDTIRRMGFGHVIAGRRHALIVERGVSLVALEGQGGALRTAYEGNIFAPEERYVVTLRP